MKNTIKFLCSGLVLICLSACGGKEDAPSEGSYRYEHIQEFVTEYGDSILSRANSEIDLQNLMLELNCRYHELLAAGDTIAAEYFILAINEYVEARNPELASSLGISRHHPGMIMGVAR